MTRQLAAFLALAALAAAPAAAAPGRVLVGVMPGKDLEQVGRAVEGATRGDLLPGIRQLRALVLSVPDVVTAVEAATSVPGVEYAEPAEARRALAFEPNDPLFAGQWYVPAIRAFDFWAEKPSLGSVLVAVIDSGVDGNHPDLKDRIARAKSFVKGPARVDTIGHGTMIAGVIAAALDNAQGIAGVAFPAELLIAKVVGANGEISLEAEARAIRWAVDQGARVINLSLGGPRDPRNPERDTYSELEQRAIDYATRKGAILVAATGNCQAVCPYRFASYPAALAHVLGVSAIDPAGKTPAFSNRDDRHNDLTAPGDGIVSTFPLALSDSNCEQPGYSLCAEVEEYRGGEGTSFAAPLVSAAAALVLAQRPELKATQVGDILRLSAADIRAPGRDRQSGSGRLDIAAAMALLGGSIPRADAFEPNDDAGSRAYDVFFRRSERAIEATLDRYEDDADVYRIYLAAGDQATLTLRGPAGTDTNLVLWEPGTESVVGPRTQGVVAQSSSKPGARERIRYQAEKTGWFYANVRLADGPGGPYRLAIEKERRGPALAE
jgi:subtilisin family serine protease